MKFILAMVLALAFPAWGAVIGTAKNALGGDITLTNEVSKICGGSTKKITTEHSGLVVEGCWKRLDEQDDTIMVYWPAAGIHFYPMSEFKMKKSMKGWL